MSLFSQLTDHKDILQESIQPVEEGWGLVLLRLGMIATGYGAGAMVGKGAISKTAGLALGVIPGNVAHFKHMNLSQAYLEKAFKNKKLIDYLKKACGEVFTKEHKKNPDLTKDIAKAIDTSKKPFKTSAKIIAKSLSAVSLKQYLVNWNSTLIDAGKHSVYPRVPGYTVTVAFDTDHIDDVQVIFFDKKKEQFKNFKVAAPDNKDLGFYEEDLLGRKK